LNHQFLWISGCPQKVASLSVPPCSCFFLGKAIQRWPLTTIFEGLTARQTPCGIVAELQQQSKFGVSECSMFHPHSSTVVMSDFHFGKFKSYKPIDFIGCFCGRFFWNSKMRNVTSLRGGLKSGHFEIRSISVSH
jgi:hypothetical protein